MWNVSNALGKSFFVSGLLPALAFFAGLDLMIMPHLFGDRRLVHVELLGVPGVAYVLGGVFLGFLLLALNAPIVKGYENGFFLSSWLKRRNQKRQRQLYTALIARRADYLRALEAGKDVQLALAKLEAVQGRVESVEGSQSLPHNFAYVKPTALGNAFAVMEEYAYERYGMDAVVNWPRLVAVIPESYQSLIADLKTTLDFLLNLSLLSGLFALGLLGVGVWFRTFLTLTYALPAMLLAYALYRVAVGATRDLGEAIMSSFDLFRGDLLEKFSLPKPANLSAEQRTWLMLASFIRRGEAFYFPLELTNQGDRRMLQEELSQHTHNLYMLRKQTSVYAAGEGPLYLQNQIVAENKAIEEIKAKLASPD